MAKRARGSTTRPGQRAPLQRSSTIRPTPVTKPAATPVSRPMSLTDEEEVRAAELEARILAEERAAEEASRRSRDRSRRPAPEPVGRSGSLAVQAAEEYAYVARDVRRLTIIGGAMIAFLLILWAVIQVTGLGPF